MTLMELTGHESGIIIYGGNIVGVWNWNQCEDDQIPIASPLGTQLDWTEEGCFEGVSPDDGTFMHDIREALPGKVWIERHEDGTASAETDMDIVSDVYNDLFRLFCQSLEPFDYEGTIYHLANGYTVISPTMWN